MDVDVDNLDHEQLLSSLKAFMTQEGLASEITEAEAAQIRKYMDDLRNYYDKLYDSMVSANEVVREAMDEWAERTDEQLERYSKLNKTLDYYNNIIDLIGRKQLKLSTGDIANMYRTQIHNDENELRSLQLLQEEYARELQAANDMYQRALASGDQDTIKQTQETLKKVQGLYDDTIQKVRDQTIKTQEDINALGQQMIDGMIEDFKQKLGDLDVLAERYARQRENDHLYLEDYEKYHALNKMVNDIEKSMNNTSNIALRGRYSDLLDKINAKQATGAKMTQREVDILERKIALLQAEDELMNARQMKSDVRMTRDNEGNFSYTYTADQEAIDNAEQNVSDRYFDLKQYLSQQIEQNGADILQTQQEFADAVAQIWDDFNNGRISSREEALALIDELEQQYNERLQLLFDEEGMLFDEERELRDNDLAHLQEITGLKLDERESFVTNFEETIEGRITPGFQTLEDQRKLWAEAETEACETSKKAFEEWWQKTNELLGLAGTDADNFKTKFNQDLIDVQQESDKTAEDFRNVVNDMSGKMNDVMGSADMMNSNWQGNMSNMRNEIFQTCNELDTMLRKLKDNEDQGKNTETQANITKSALDLSAQAAESAVGAYEAAAEAARDAAAAARDAAAAMREMASAAASAPKETHVTTLYNGPGGSAGTVQNWYWDDNGNMVPMATGGYTGAWGPEGKIAMLHEKELVLNKEDTSNMLNIVDITRDLINSFGASSGLNNIINSIANASQLAMAGAGTMDQNVHIEANFPNVQSHSEIELALNNLINSASQYVNRK